VIDDVLATGGTLVAAYKLLLSAGFEVCGAITLLEIAILNGKQLLDQHGIANRSVLIS
jgi:adenine phosphoribosyltransferase